MSVLHIGGEREIYTGEETIVRGSEGRRGGHEEEKKGTVRWMEGVSDTNDRRMEERRE